MDAARGFLGESGAGGEQGELFGFFADDAAVGEGVGEHRLVVVESLGPGRRRVDHEGEPCGEGGEPAFAAFAECGGAGGDDAGAG